MGENNETTAGDLCTKVLVQRAVLYVRPERQCNPRNFEVDLRPPGSLVHPEPN